MPRVETHLSRGEVVSLLYDKLSLIQSEAESVEGHEGPWERRHFVDAQQRMKRIAVEARRAASLIETHLQVSKAGHCLHCGKIYAEHSDAVAAPLQEGGPRVRVKGSSEPRPQCQALQRLFESVEIETYLPLKLEVSDA